MCVLLQCHHLSTSQQLMGQYIDNTLSYKGLYYGKHSQLPSTKLVTLPQLWPCILVDVVSCTMDEFKNNVEVVALKLAVY